MPRNPKRLTVSELVATWTGSASIPGLTDEEVDARANVQCTVERKLASVPARDAVEVFQKMDILKELVGYTLDPTAIRLLASVRRDLHNLQQGSAA